MVSAITMTYSHEAAGIACAAMAAGLQSVISFTVETDGRLPSGESLKDAIETVDDETDGAPAYFMINCAHPSHFDAVLDSGGGWVGRIRGVRANASAKSHAELDAATELDPGDPVDFGRRLSRDARSFRPHRRARRLLRHGRKAHFRDLRCLPVTGGYSEKVEAYPSISSRSISSSSHSSSSAASVARSLSSAAMVFWNEAGSRS